MSSIQSADLQKCMQQLQQHFHISVVSKRSFKDVQKITNKYFSSKHSEFKSKTEIPELRKFNKILHDDVSQSHFICGSLCSSYIAEERQGIMLLASILGGQHLSAMLNLELREKHGLAYTVESSLSSFHDSGMLYHYFTCEHRKLNKAVKLMHNTFASLIHTKFDEEQLSIAKRILKSQYHLYFEHALNRALFHAKYYQYHKTCISTEEWINNFEKTDAETLQQLAQKYLSPESISSLSMIKDKK
jgi:predicted Zn-dependent peptidase